MCTWRVALFSIFSLIMTKNIKKKIYEGFTLIEILVVISIIAIIVAFSMFGLQGTFEESRNTQRKSDMDQYKIALENYSNNTNGLYPSYTTEPMDLATVCSSNDLADFCPEDPDDTGVSYQYISDGDGSGNATATFYAIWADIEGEDDSWQLCSDGRVGYAESAPAAGGCSVASPVAP